MRNVKFLIRNKSAFYGLIVSNVFSALLNISVYWNVGVFPDLISIIVNGVGDEEEALKLASNKYRRYTLDIVGIAFLFSNQFSFAPSFDAVM